MNGILLTQNGGILGPIAKVLGYIMEGIFTVIDAIGIPNIGLAIILFTIVVNLLMLPLTIKQQKFSKLSAKINPEIQAIQAKYKNKKDNASTMMQNQEIQAVYAKYGTSPTGSCLYLLIQMPILFALYRVIYSIPAYVRKVGNVFRVLAAKIIEKDGADFIVNSEVETISKTVAMYGKSLTKDGATSVDIENGVVDVLNKLSSDDMLSISNHYGLSNLEYEGERILSYVNEAGENVSGLIDKFNNFLGINMGDAPGHIIKEAWADGAWLILIGALMIPVLSAVTQWINSKLMPQPETKPNDSTSSMSQSMKTMNAIMPLMSAWFCFTLPAGMGLYWVAGSVVRSVQQVVINKQIDKMDFDEIIKKNAVKSSKKMEKIKENQERINAYANMKTKNLSNRANVNTSASENNSSSNKNTSGSAPKSGSMMAKANMVQNYNEKKNK